MILLPDLFELLLHAGRRIHRLCGGHEKRTPNADFGPNLPPDRRVLSIHET
jgi:hypothetical protein